MQASEPANQHKAKAKLDLGPSTAPTPQSQSVPAHVFTQPTPVLPLILPHTTHQYGAAVRVTHSDRFGRSAEARHGDLPPLQPPDQSLDRTCLAPPPWPHLWSARPGSGPTGVYRRVAARGGAVSHLAGVVDTPALDRAGVLLTTTLSEPALHQTASASSIRLASLHVDERVLVIPQAARSHTCL